MRPIKHIVSLLLVVLLSTAGLPLFSPEDASRDGSIDLRDAVLLTQGLSGDIDRSGVFGRDFTSLVKAIRTVAGLRADIRHHTDHSSIPDASILKERHDQSLMSAIPSLALTGERQPFPSDHPTVYHSIFLTPATPPPESNMA